MLRDEEGLGDLVVAQPLRHEEGHLGLPLREPAPGADLLGRREGRHPAVGCDGDEEGVAEGVARRRQEDGAEGVAGAGRPHLGRHGRPGGGLAPPGEADRASPPGQLGQDGLGEGRLGVGGEEADEGLVPVRLAAVGVEGGEGLGDGVERGAVGAEAVERVEAGLEGGDEHRQHRELRSTVGCAEARAQGPQDGVALGPRRDEAGVVADAVLEEHLVPDRRAVDGEAAAADDLGHDLPRERFDAEGPAVGVPHVRGLVPVRDHVRRDLLGERHEARRDVVAVVGVVGPVAGGEAEEGVAAAEELADLGVDLAPPGVHVGHGQRGDERAGGGFEPREIAGGERERHAGVPRERQARSGILRPWVPPGKPPKPQ